MTLGRTQFALVLAWGVTVHKVQGLSLDRAVLDLGESVFASGRHMWRLAASAHWRVCASKIGSQSV